MTCDNKRVEDSFVVNSFSFPCACKELCFFSFLFWFYVFDLFVWFMGWWCDHGKEWPRILFLWILMATSMLLRCFTQKWKGLGYGVESWVKFDTYLAPIVASIYLMWANALRSSNLFFFARSHFNRPIDILAIRWLAKLIVAN
jgi:hypothetical protein